ncbi:MAG: hypothetical protein RMI91_09830 [Gemmatales bacterium]|nr:hypothetical protein [Gemmatales bacterium]MDW7994940.1 hypothetical protein [Gemmatales bacterium]
MPHHFARQWWEREAVGERRRIAEGWYLKDISIDDSLIDLIVAQQHAAFVVTGAAAFCISAYPDILQQHDSTQSWWLEVKTATEDEICSLYFDVRINFQKDMYRRAAATLFDSFLASGARDSPNAVKNAQALHLRPPPRNIVAESISRRRDKRLLRCPVDLASRWPMVLLDPATNCELTSLGGPVFSPTGETFICGRTANWFSEVTIRSGPAFDPVTWNDAAFLAIESTGFIQRRAFLDGLTQRAVEHGAIQIY